MPFMYAVGLYLRFIALVALGPVLWMLCGIVTAVLVHSSDEGSFNSLYGAGLGAVIGYIVSAVYEGALVFWGAAWVSVRAVHYVRNTDRFGLALP